jgi:assimilatory nitrate reductase catalytic subunit
VESGREGRGPFYFPDGKARFHAIAYEPPTEDVDEDYPIILTTGRTINMFLSGNQTRRIGPLVDQYAEPLLELHPLLAEKHHINDGEWVTVESRRGRTTIRCQVVETIRPDVVFVPYHWPGEKSINLVTISSQDPISKIPEYKVCAVRLSRAQQPDYARRLEAQQ